MLRCGQSRRRLCRRKNRFQHARCSSLEADTGKEIWKIKLGEINKGETMTVAPLIVKNKVLVGNSGGEMGVRGWAHRARSKQR
jgi:hypothetical protein